MAEPSEQTTSQSISTAPAPVVSLETELTCSICTDLLHNPLTLLDCLHTFCGACLKEWFRFQADRIESLPGPPLPREPRSTHAPPAGKQYATPGTMLGCRRYWICFWACTLRRERAKRRKREMDRRYTRGERVMRRLKFEDRSEEEARRDEEERRLIDEVRAVSLREATERALQGSSSSPSGRRERPRDTRAENAAAAATGEQQRRQIEHQASLRSLISLEGGEMTPSDIEREIEEFARQIQEEGLLDGIDLDNIDLSTNDELSRKITEAYRRRQREKARRQREQRARSTSRAPTMGSERERGRERDPDRDREGERDQDRERERNRERDRSTAPPRSASRNRDPSARPTSRHSMAGHTSSHSRAPSVTSVDDRARYPPSASASASALLEVPDPTTVRRRRASSAGRSATIPPVQLEGRVPERARSETGTRDSSSTRGSDGRSSGSPTTTTAPASSGSRTSSFSSRTGAIPGDRLSVPGPLPSRDPSPETRHRHRQTPLILLPPPIPNPTPASASATSNFPPFVPERASDQSALFNLLPPIHPKRAALLLSEMQSPRRR
ncbi:SH3 domain-containing protein [Thermochaetoides thermophila DSM 1495]|uniref:SH3 domain-containing protein n=1 Tax=Chaetomium thermophilum (strain DSM 1495 / CBS 144.50 / IMI 039719) TaxID=759272 RepID=G0SFG8_CHATD|nr:SH3 domain-containing protein [Thermochaetoides thermophila DSM 1495]EGS17733.1 SH3 domain-containing protein [Thermochaetoides thermophila DSM 1495]